MSASEILDRLKKGDLTSTPCDIQDYLVIPLSKNKKLGQTELQLYSEYAAKFLHVLVYKLEEVKDLEFTLEMMKDCYEVSRLSPCAKRSKDKMYAENLLYHLITKLIKKKELSWTLSFCGCLYEGLVAAPSGEVVSNLASSSYVALWNAMIASDKDQNKSLLNLECRAMALKLLGISKKDTHVFLDRLHQAISRVQTTISVKGITSGKGFDIAMGMIDTALTAVSLRSNQAEDTYTHITQEDAINTVVQILFTKVKFLLFLERYKCAAGVSSNFAKTLNSYFPSNGRSVHTDSFVGLGQLCMVTTHAHKLRSVMQEDKNNKSGTSPQSVCSSEISDSLNCFLQNNRREGCKNHCPHYCQLSVQQASLALEYICQVAQYMSHQKLPLRILPFEMISDFCHCIVVLVDKSNSTNICRPTNFTEELPSQIDIELMQLKIAHYWLVLSKPDACSKLHQTTLSAVRDAESRLVSLSVSKDVLQSAHVSIAEISLKLGRHCYFGRRFSEAIPYLEVTCRHVEQCLSNSTLESLQNGRYHAFLADAYRHEGRLEEALQSVVHGLRCDSASVSELTECWVKVKADIQKTHKEDLLLTRTLYNCYQDPRFVNPCLCPPEGSTCEGGSPVLSAHTLLQAELQALKSYWSPLHSCQLSVIQEFSEHTADPAERAQLTVEKVQVLWITRTSQTVQLECCVQAVAELEAVLEGPRGTRDTPPTHLHDHLAQAHLWSYIVRDVTPQDLLKGLQDSKLTAPLGDDAQPGSPVSSKVNPAHNFENGINIAMETELLRPVDRALALWEKIILSEDVESQLQNIKQTMDFIMIIAAIYKLAKKHVHQCRALGLVVTLSRFSKTHALSLQARAQLLLLMNELRQLHFSEELILDTDCWVHRLSSDKLRQSVRYTEYLQAKAEAQLLMGKTEDAADTLKEALDIKSKNFKPRSKETMITEALLQGLSVRLKEAQMTACSVGPSMTATQPSDEGDTKLEQLHQATRLIGKVVCSLMGNWMINTGLASGSDGHKVPDNLLEKWELLDHLLTTLYEAGMYAIAVGAAREALCRLTMGLRLSKAFNIPRRLAEFHLAIASLDTMSGKHSDCKSHLRVVSYILESSEITKAEPSAQADQKDPDKDDSGFLLQSKPLQVHGDLSEGWSDTEEVLDRSGCASPQTKQARAETPPHWSHTVTCTCTLCQDIVIEKLSMCKFSTQTQMDISKEDYSSAQTSLQSLVKHFSHLTSRSKQMVKKLGCGLMEILENDSKEKVPKNEGKSQKITKKENKKRLGAEPSVYQDLMVDVCLQVCKVAVHTNNTAMFDKWRAKCEELCDFVKCPWMFQKHNVLAELQYLGVVSYIHVKPVEDTGSDLVDKLCQMVSDITIKDSGDVHTPKPHRSSKKTPLNPGHPESNHQTIQKHVTGKQSDSSMDQSPELWSDLPQLPKAPVKARLAQASRSVLCKPLSKMSRGKKNPAPSLSMVGSPSIIEASKTPATKPNAKGRHGKPKSSIPMRIYEDLSMAQTPLRTPVRVTDSMKTPISVCSSKRAMLDMLIYSDSEDDTRNNTQKAKTKTRQAPSSKSTSRRGKKEILDDTDAPNKVTSKRGIFNKRGKSAKSKPSEKSDEVDIKVSSPVQSLFMRNLKKKVESKVVSLPAGGVYDFMADDEDVQETNKTSKPTKKSTKPTKKSKSSKVDKSVSDVEVVRQECEDPQQPDHRLPAQPHPAAPSLSARGTTRVSVSVKPEGGRPDRLTRARTRHIEEARVESSEEDVEAGHLTLDDSADLSLDMSCTSDVLEPFNVTSSPVPSLRVNGELVEERLTFTEADDRVTPLSELVLDRGDGPATSH